MDKRLYLRIPSFEELGYRQKILAQPDTMSYNRGYEIGLDNYNNETGCIDFREEYWEDWFSRWVNNMPDRYYAYIIKCDEHSPIGEVALRYVEEKAAYCVNIIIEARYRGMGYSEEALKLLADAAFNELNAEKIYDDFPAARVSADRAFKRVGFKRVTDDMVELTRKDYLLTIST